MSNKKQNLKNIIKPPMEVIYKDELEALKQNDKYPKPDFFNLSPKMVRTFILGSNNKPLKYKVNGKEKEIIIEQKYFGNDSLIERAIITLTGNRGLMLIGEPGTAKTMLSELLTAAISGNSQNTIQGTSGITENSIKYSWNYSILLSKGPVPEALIPSPVYVGMEKGVITRFEEITRVPSEIQDSLISIMSDKVLNIPETDSTLFAKRGFNIIATANSRDRGVNEMSSALKRRFNFETVKPIDNLKLETEIIKKESQKLLSYNDIKIDINNDLVKMLAITFSELRNGIGQNGEKLEKMNSTVSTAEAVSVFYSSALDAHYYDEGKITPKHIARNISGSLIKDNKDDVTILKNYFNAIVKKRGKKDDIWKSFYDSKNLILD